MDKRLKKSIQTTIDHYNPIKRPKAALSGIKNGLLPAWRHRLSQKNIRNDIQAGFSGAILLFPQAMAYAVIAGLPPIYGIYCALVPTMVAAYFGSSWHMVSGPTAAMSLFLFSVVSSVATPGSMDYIQTILMLTLMAGAIQLLLGLFRMGAIVNFVSDSVIIGFTTGAGVLIIASQLGNFLGIPKGDQHNLVGFLVHNAANLDNINWYSFAVATITLLSAVAALKIKFLTRIPYLIFSLLIGSVAAFAINWFYGGATTTGLTPMAEISSVIPPLSWPIGSVERAYTLAPAAIALALLGLTEAISIARSLSLHSGQIIDSNREFTAQGLSNVLGAFFSGYTSSGSFTRSGANYESNAKSPLSAILSAIFVLIIGLLLAPLTTYLVKPVLAGSLIVIAFKLISFQHIDRLHNTSRKASIVMWVSLVSAILIGLEFAIFAGAGLSMLFYLDRVSNPQVHYARATRKDNAHHFLYSSRPSDCPQLMILFIDGSLFFGATANLHTKIQDIRELHPEKKYFLLLCAGINHLDIHGADLLRRITLEQRNLGGDVFFQGLKSAPMRMLVAAGHHKVIGTGNFYNAGPGTLDSIYERMDEETCWECTELSFPVCRLKATERSNLEDHDGEFNLVMRET